jgi:hypothetical protein
VVTVFIGVPGLLLLWWKRHEIRALDRDQLDPNEDAQGEPQPATSG